MVFTLLSSIENRTSQEDNDSVNHSPIVMLPTVALPHVVRIDVQLDEIIISEKGGQLVLKMQRFSARSHACITSIPGIIWNREERCWYLKPSVEIWAYLRKLNISHIGWVIASRTLPPEPEVETIDVGDVSESTISRVDAERAESARKILASSKYSFKTTPYEHQITATALATSRPVFALLMEMGTGKTKAWIDAASLLILLKRIEGALIVAPLAVCHNWKKEILAHSPLPDEMKRVVVLTGSMVEREKELARHGAYDFFITNYESLARMEKSLVRVMRSRKMAMVLDESTRIKNHAAKQSKAARRIGLVARARYILTGTPITQSPMDAFGQFRFLDPRILGHDTFTGFRAEYGVRGGFKGKEVVSYKNLDRLAARIAAYSYRVLKKDCLDLPPKRYRVLELDMGERQKALYLQMRERAVAEMEGKVLAAPLVITKLLRLSQIASGLFPVIDENTGETTSVESIADAPKLPALVELIEEAYESRQKVIVWSRFKEDVIRIEKVLGNKAVSYYGDVSIKERDRRVNAFQTDSSVRVFVGQVRTGGIGLTLTAASLVIFYSNSYSLEDRLQAEDRAHRIGQHADTVDYVDLVCRGSIDRLVVRALKDKKQLADIVTGDNVREMLTSKE